MSVAAVETIRVFISYSHDSPEHLERVLGLSDRLRHDGIDCLIDQYEMSPREGWPQWTMNRIEEARFVLVICTEIYHRRVRGGEESGKGLGAKWEGAIITQELYDSEANNDKFIPILFSTEDAAHIPVYLRGVARYVLDEDYENLYRRLTHQPKYLKPALGTLRSLPSLDRKEDFLPVPESRAGKPAASDASLPTFSNAERLSKLPSDAIVSLQSSLQSYLPARWIFGGIAGLAALAFILLLLIKSSLFMKPGPEPPPKPDPEPIAMYKVRVRALLGEKSVDDAVLSSSVHIEPRKIEEVWEFDIPAASLPEDRQVTIYALKRAAISLYGSAKVTLDKDPVVPVKILLSMSTGLATSDPVPPGPTERPAPIAIYRVRVIVRDSEQRLVDDAVIQSSLGGEIKQVAGGWEIDIPAANKPASGVLKISASKASAFLKGKTSLRLNKDPNPTAEIQLQSNPSARAKGRVIDSSSQAVAGALVYVLGFERERVQTGPNGEFDLPAHAADGQTVRLHVEKAGYSSEEPYQMAGRRVTVILRKGGQ